MGLCLQECIGLDHNSMAHQNPIYTIVRQLRYYKDDYYNKKYTKKRMYKVYILLSLQLNS